MTNQKNWSLTLWRKKCERLAMEIKLAENPHCFCGAPAVTCHHFFPKSISAYLRCDSRNLIPICNSCHFAHHTKGDPKIHITIIEELGLDWYNELLQDSQVRIKSNLGYWKKVYAELEKDNCQKVLKEL